jgi:hypothetical protein
VWGRLRQALESQLGDASEHLVRIAFNPVAFDQSLALQAVNQPGKFTSYIYMI